MYEPAPNRRARVTFAEELPVEDEPDHRLHEHEHDPDRLAHQVAHLPHDHEPGVAERRSCCRGPPRRSRGPCSGDRRRRATAARRRPTRRRCPRRRAPRGSPAAPGRRSRRARRASRPSSDLLGRRADAREHALRVLDRAVLELDVHGVAAQLRASAPSGVPSTTTLPCETIATRSASWSASSR